MTTTMKPYYVEESKSQLSGNWNPYFRKHQPVLEFIENYKNNNSLSIYKGEKENSNNVIYIVFGVEFNEIGFLSIDTENNSNSLNLLYIHPSYRRQGLATRLLQLATQDLEHLIVAEYDVFSFGTLKDKSDWNLTLKLEQLKEFYKKNKITIISNK